MVERVTLHRAPTTVADAIAGWLDARLKADVDVSDRFLGRYADDELPRALAEVRVHSPYDRESEKTMLGVVRYDGLAVKRALNARLAEDDRSPGTFT